MTLAGLLTAMGQVVAFADPAGRHGGDRARQQEPAETTATESAGGVVSWEGNGSENLPCDGGHWVLAPAFNIDGATLTVNGSTYPMTQSGNGSWWADSSGMIEGTVEAFVTFTGEGDARNHLQLSHCLAAPTTPPSTPPTTPPSTPPTTPPSTPPTTPPSTPPEATGTDTPVVRPTRVKPPSSPLAFTGPEAAIPLGALSLSLFTIGSALMWAGARRSRRNDEDVM